MSNFTRSRRAASVIGATGFIALSMAGPASARQDPGNGSQAEWRCSTSCYEGPAGSGTTFGPDGNSVEVLQLGAGILAGLALAGAGVAVASRRSHAHAAHPA
ncbi:hypothetical protein ACOCJ4_16480 [Knoellia sp. CPCC 206435]|uniref:hypothetical protein n=1 Tax=Knoellia terrae TaxID=3404797 RepID=UPI003B42FF93